ncbi:MAG: hypothetical protein JWR33_267 [Naasia sp.]|jgi:hypothetical protein|uniref:DUF3027 domain-containing protein n=1 Tax=Naasia sp. TaxID=2546198 RepID=UPI00262C25AD|nr:DUF3027 domain-containing protein [Naasia sp.]MCU1569526.1 hypothetical protein [Naasia sp.]
MTSMRDAGAGDAAVVAAARAALLETTPDDTVGELIGLDEVSEGVLDVRFGTAMPGYPGWSWAVYVSVLDGADEPSVLELTLLPGEDALVAPEWVPWSDRLVDYQIAQDAKDGEGSLVIDDDDDEGPDEDDLLDDEDDVLDGVEFEDAEAELELVDEDDEDDALDQRAAPHADDGDMAVSAEDTGAETGADAIERVR